MLLLTALGLWAITPASAHTALLEASPGPDQTVGGTVTGIDLAFLDPISDAIVTVSYNGAPVAGTTTVSNGDLIRFDFDEPLQAPGRYQVFYEMTSFDLDYTTSGFFFTFDTNAAPLIRLEAPTAGGDSSFPLVPTIVAAVVVVALLAAFVWYFDARRRLGLTTDGHAPDGGPYGDYGDGDGYVDDGYGRGDDEYDEYHDRGHHR